MSAIQSLLRVMTLRDAEAIVLETGKVPLLRRRGQIETMSMPPLEAGWLEDFVQPLLGGRSVGEHPNQALFRDDENNVYSLSIERQAIGLRVTARKASNAPAAPKPPPPAGTSSSAWWAKKDGASGVGPRPEAAPIAPISPSPSGPAIAVADDLPTARARLARLLAPAIALARDHGATDVFLSSHQPARMRVDGRLESLDIAFDDAELAACCATELDAGLDIDGTRVRANAFSHLGGHAVAARLVRDRIPALAELGLPGELGATVDLRDGLVVVCGPTGAGKSTTLAALVELLDQRRAAHVITLEEPIEYRFQPRRCLVHQREIGTHAPSFAAGIRAALREAPDVIVVGEMRDKETIAAALTAAETGHLVLATLHASSAAGAVDRMIDAFPESAQRQVRWQLASVLRTVATQFLLPRKDGGRAVAVEVVPVNTAVSNIIRKGDLYTLPTAITSGREAGMVPLERSLAKLVESGAVSPQAVKRIASDHDLLNALSPKGR